MRLVVVAVTLAVACEPPGYHQGQGATPDASVDSSVPAPDAPGSGSATGSGSGACTNVFQLFGYGSVQSVWLTGDFVQWGANPGSGAIPMLLGSNAAWSVSHDFMSGTYQYKFIVNGTTYIADPSDANVIDDGFGGHNSVYVCN
jgi:hypothetical protein